MSSSSAPHKEVAAVRKELRAIRSDVENQKHQYTSTASNGLAQAIDKANTMFDVTKTDARAGALDASLLSYTSALGAEQAGNLDKQTPSNFIKRLLIKFGYRAGKHIKWQDLASEVEEQEIYRLAPAVSFALSKFDTPEKKEKKERKRRQAGPTEPMQTADAVSVEQLQEVEEDKAQVARMKVLFGVIQTASEARERAGQPRKLNLFQLLLNPSSFSQTVENFFDFAFLIKDGFVRLLPEADCAYVTDAKPPTPDEYNAGLLRSQNILSLDHPVYQKLVQRWCTPGYERLLPARSGGGGGSSGAMSGAGNGKKKARTGA